MARLAFFVAPALLGSGVALAAPVQQALPSSAEGRASVAEAFRAQVVSVDASFTNAHRERAGAMLDRLVVRPDTLTPAQFELALAEIAALPNNGHTQLLTARWKRDYAQLGVRFVLADDGLWVGDAAPEYEELVGSRVERLEGHTLDELRDVWSRYATGRPGYRDQSMPIFLESPPMLRAAGVGGGRDGVALELGDGRRVEVGVTDWPAPDGIWTFLPEVRPLMLAAAGRIEGTPLYLQEPESFFRIVELPERDAVYLQFRANVDFLGRTDLGAAARAAIDRLRAIAPRFVIVDQRFNIGGDLNNTRDLMQAIPQIVPEGGAIFAITSGRTFSAGIASMGYLRQAADRAERRLTIIGAPVGDELEFWAEGQPANPGAGLLVLVATERHNYMTDCPEPDCHGSIRRHPIRVESVDPDIRPRFTYDDLVSGRDPYLQAAFEAMDGFDGAFAPLADPPRADSIVFEAGAIRLRGLLRLPAGRGPHHAVLLLPGGGRRHLTLEPDYWAERFVDAGIASFVYHKRGTGESDGDWATATFDDLIADAGAAVTMLRDHPAIGERIGVMGFSQGGRFAPVVAARYGLDAVVSIAGPHTPPADTRLYALENSLIEYANGRDVEKAAIAAALDLWREYFRDVDPDAPARSVGRLDDRILALRHHLPAQLLPNPSEAFQPAPYLNSLDFRSGEDLRALTAPYLAMYGERDVTVPTDASVAILEELLEASGSGNPTIVVIAGSGHGLNDESGERHPVYVSLPVEWMRERLLD